MAKTEALDCVEVKRRAQRALLSEIRGASLKQELEALHRLAEESPLWKRLRKATRVPAARPTTTAGKQRRSG